MRTLASKVVGSDSSPRVAQRRNYFFFALFLVCCAAVAVQGCGKNTKPNIHALGDLNKSGMIIAGETDTISFRRAQETFPKAKMQSFDDADDMFVALKDGSIDAISYDRPSLEYFAAKDSDYHVLSDVVADGCVVLAAPNNQRDLMMQVDEFIDLFRAEHPYEDAVSKWNGALKPEDNSAKSVYQDMYDRWYKNATSQTMPAIPRPEAPVNAGRPYVVGIASDNEPASFLLTNAPADYVQEYGEISGFEAEFIRRMALCLNIEVVVKPMLYLDLIAAVVNNELDLAIGALDRTPELSQSILFSKPHFDAPVGVMILSERWKSEGSAADAAQAGSVLTVDDMSFRQRLRRSFEKTFIVERRWTLFLKGLLNTIYITAVATVLGTVLAFVQCYMRRSRRPWLRYPAKVYIAIMQGTPILVILLVLYYVVFTKISLTGELVAAIALALNFAAYAGEQMRTGVDGIDQGLLEAARALGFGRFDVFRKVIFPIACRRIMPVYKGEFISLLKTTSIVGYVAIQDLTKASDIVRGRTYEAFFPLIATAIIYLLTAHLLASGFAYLEYRLNPVTRRKRAKGEVNV